MSGPAPTPDWSDQDFETTLEGEVHEDFAYEPIESINLSMDEPVAYATTTPAPLTAAFAGSASGGADQPVPRITIHAACDRAETARAVSATARDRRLAKATVTAELGGIDAALPRLASQRSPDLLILESTASSSTLLGQLDRLAELVDETTKVIVIGATNDITLYRELMARGVSEYLVGPIEPLQLARAIGTLYVDPDKPFAGRLVSVVGAKGGVGASTIAHNLAWCIAERCGAHTTLVDLDLAFGTAALDFNQEPAQTVADALAAPDRLDHVLLDRLLTRQTERLLMFSAPSALDRELDFEAPAYDLLIDSVRRTAPFVVLDLPHLWTPWARDTLVASDMIMLVATPELASLRNAKNMVDRLARLRVNDAKPHIILNMTGVTKRPEIPTKDFADSLGCELTAEIPFEPAAFGQAANGGQMLGEINTPSRGAREIEALAQLVCGRPVTTRKQASLLDKLPFLKR